MSTATPLLFFKNTSGAIYGTVPGPARVDVTVNSDASFNLAIPKSHSKTCFKSPEICIIHNYYIIGNGMP